jgi:predicted Na+-dependent transporter
MLGVGLGLTPRDFARTGAEQRSPLGRGVAFSVVGVPLLAWFTVRLLPLPWTVRIGIFLSAASPGGSTGVLLPRQGRGDVGVAVLSMVAMTVLGAASTPLLVGAFAPDVGQVAVLTHILQMAKTLGIT